MCSCVGDDGVKQAQADTSSSKMRNRDHSPNTPGVGTIRFPRWGLRTDGSSTNYVTIGYSGDVVARVRVVAIRACKVVKRSVLHQKLLT
jgi:hypothetical protein